MNVVKSVTRFIFPPSCVNCGRYNYWLCDKCKSELQPMLPECGICRRISPGFQTHPECLANNSVKKYLVLWGYNECAAKILALFKYASVKDIQSLFDEMLVLQQSKINAYINQTTLIPIPVHWKRSFDRGYNQSEIIAHIISRKCNFPCSSKILSRIRNTKHQAHLKREERMKNITNCFAAKYRTDLTTDSLTIVDDVLTTGTTINEAAKILSSVYPDKEIYALCLFRGKPNYSTLK